MIILGQSFTEIIAHIYDDLKFPKENEVSWTIEEVDTQRYIKQYNIPIKAKYLGIIWVEEHILFFHKKAFIGYVDNEGIFKNENCNLHRFEPYTAKIRNKLSPVFNALKMFELWEQEKNPNLKEQIFQLLKQEVAKGNNNFQKIHRYLNQINLNFE